MPLCQPTRVFRSQTYWFFLYEGGLVILSNFSMSSRRYGVSVNSRWEEECLTQAPIVYCWNVGLELMRLTLARLRRRRLVKSHITGRGRTPVFTDLCQDPSTVVRHDSDKSSKPTYLQTLTHFDWCHYITIKIRTWFESWPEFGCWTYTMRSRNASHMIQFIPVCSGSLCSCSG